MNSSQPDQAVDYLVIGHITRDLTPHGPRIGGTAAYAAVLASRAGFRVGVVTSTSGSLDLTPLEGAALHDTCSRENTTFRNTYTPHGREQQLLGRADPITLDMIPPAWRSAEIVHLAPVIQELSPALGEAFPNALLGFSLQGWLRSGRAPGPVEYQPFPEGFPSYRRRESVGVVSLEDLDGREDRLEPLLDRFSLLILTRGDQPLSIYPTGAPYSVQVQPRAEIDPTGAGDIFAAAFLISYCRQGDHRRAARAAADLAALSVDKSGLAGVPTQPHLNQLLKVNQAWEKSTP